MATPMNSASFRQVVEPLLNKHFDGVYSQRKDEWKAVFSEEAGLDRAFEEETVFFGFNAAPELGDGAAVTYEQGGILYTVRFNFKQYGLAFALTKIMQEDGDHVRFGTIFSKHLAQAMVETKETVLANHINRAFNSSYVGGDGKELCATDHPIRGGTFSNELATPAALSPTSLEQILIQVAGAVDNNGKKVRISPERLVISKENVFNAEVILNSTLKSGTANNDINAIKSMGMLPKETAVITRMTSTTAWFVKTDIARGLVLKMRRKMSKGMEGDFDTDSMRYKATERYGSNWIDPRCLFGTAGA